MLAALDLRSCGDAHVFIDGGSNLGESVDAFYGGAMHRCALHSPNRLYGDSWQSASAAQRAERVASLATPKLWCVRSFEANPRLLPALHEREKSQRANKLNVRYIDGLLGTTTGKHYPRKVVTYSREPSGSSATIFDWREVHFAGVPPNLAEENVVGPTYDVRDVIAEALRHHPKAEIALKLDVEGGEFSILDALLEPHDRRASPSSPPLLCNVSFLFVEYHNLHANLSKCACTEAQNAHEP
jgi:FkbM family methyltransferase